MESGAFQLSKMAWYQAKSSTMLESLYVERRPDTETMIAAEAANVSEYQIRA
jgi:hypothetical protein